MALVSCKECSKQISDQAVTCPHCGAPVSFRTQVATPVTVVTAKSKNIAIILAFSVVRFKTCI